MVIITLNPQVMLIYYYIIYVVIPGREKGSKRGRGRGRGRGKVTVISIHWYVIV